MSRARDRMRPSSEIPEDLSQPPAYEDVPSVASGGTNEDLLKQGECNTDGCFEPRGHIGTCVPYRKPEHEHAIFCCCLSALIDHVKEYAGEQLGASENMVDTFYELLQVHLEESWESHNGDIVAPEKDV